MITKASRAGAAALLAVAVATIATSSALGAVVTLQTPAGSSTGGQPISAKATFTTSAGQISVVLENLQADPKSVVQCLSGLQFNLSGVSGINPLVGATLSSSGGTERFVATDTSFTDGGNAASGWSLSTSGLNVDLNLLGTPTAPDHTIIGPPAGTNLYSNANNSLTNGTHSPFFAGSATFVLNIPSVTSSTTVSDATFQFNTSPGNTVTTTVPEPACAILSAAMIGIIGTARGRRRSR